MYDKLVSIEKRYHELSLLLCNPEVIADRDLFQKHSRSLSELSDIVAIFGKYKKIRQNLEEAREVLELHPDDQELAELAREEIEEQEAGLNQLDRELKLLLIPSDPNDEKNIILEIRAGTGGDEAGLFAADLFRAYLKYAENNGWRVEVLSSHQTGVGAIKEIIVSIEGKRVYSKLKYESGVHRVQRVPTTETQGRIHTSAVTVAVLPEAQDVEVELAANDLKIDVYRSSGPGGQSVNTTDSAVRITHVPSGLVVTCQDEKSQHKNKAKALKILRARLQDKLLSEQQKDIAQERRQMVGTGDRSERIRTYNFPQGRVSDHRISLTLYNLESVMAGELDSVIIPLTRHFKTEALKSI